MILAGSTAIPVVGGAASTTAYAVVGGYGMAQQQCLAARRLAFPFPEAILAVDLTGIGTAAPTSHTKSVEKRITPRTWIRLSGMGSPFPFSLTSVTSRCGKQRRRYLLSGVD